MPAHANPPPPSRRASDTRSEEAVAVARAAADAAVAEAESLLRRGEPLLAFNAAQAALAGSPGHARLRQLLGLALARAGDPDRAGRILQALLDEGVEDAETLGMLARTHKDIALRETDDAGRARHLEQARQLYERAWEGALARGAFEDALYTGINAATVACLARDVAGARRIAAAVRDMAAGGAGPAEPSYWCEATLAEAALILGDNDAARRHYAAAARLGAGRHGDLGSTRRQARLLEAHLGAGAAGMADALRVPPVVVFTGNMIDSPSRLTPRFPGASEAAVAEALRAQLEAIRPVAAYGSAACGADLICLELVRELGGETHVVLPFPPAEFRRGSVDFAPGRWGERFEKALAEADSVTVASDHRALGSIAAYEYANLILTGMGRLRAQVLDTSLRGVAVWDPHAPGAGGGAASLVSMWERLGVQMHPVLLPEIRGEPAAGAAGGRAPLPDTPPAGFTHELRAMLFGDAVGFSQLSEDQIPAYVTAFLGAVAALNRRTASRIEHVATWGDGIYAVFASIADAGRYALELSALANGFDRRAAGLPEDFNLRIALHCGPVYCGTDPVTGLPMYTGPHTSRAARIEPITPPGHVYASSAFAAVAAAQDARGFAMDYVGRIPLAKGYGTLGLYHLRPAP